MASIKYAAQAVAAIENQDICRDESLKKASIFNAPVTEWNMVPPSLKSHSSGKSSGSKTHPHQLSEKEKQRRAEMIARAREKREALIRQIRCEKKLMFLSSCVAAISAFIWILAVCTDFWYGVTGDKTQLDTTNSTSRRIFVSSHTGLWKTCRTVRLNSTDETWCKPHTLFPEQSEIIRDPGLDEHVIDYTRTVTIFAVMSLLTMVMSLFSAFYTFKNSRYVYKRLAAGLYFITMLTVLVVLEVTVTLVGYEKSHVPHNHPKGSIVTYGFSFYMGWAVFFVYLLNGCIFLVLSRKRKGEKEDGSIEDNMRIIGR